MRTLQKLCYMEWMRYFAIVAFAFTILSGILQSASALSVSGQPENNVTIQDFDIFEVGIKLDAGQKISYSYDASSGILFLLHRHEGTEVITHFTTEGKSHGDTFTAPKSGDYYLLWENLHFEQSDLSYKILFPRTLHEIEYDGKSFTLEVLSNSKVENLEFSAEEKQLSFSISTPYLTPGFVDISIPEELLGGEFTVDGSSNYSVNHGSTAHIIVNTNVGTHNIVIHGSTAIPEFPFSFLILAMALTAFVSWRFLKIKLR